MNLSCSVYARGSQITSSSRVPIHGSILTQRVPILIVGFEVDFQVSSHFYFPVTYHISHIDLDYEVYYSRGGNGACERSTQAKSLKLSSKVTICRIFKYIGQEHFRACVGYT